MKSSVTILFLISVAFLFLWAEAVSQGGSQAFCSNHLPTDRKPCPKIQKPVCGTDGHTYHNPCEFCKTVMERNGKLGLKHDGKC